jgi:hypothetical protein
MGASPTTTATSTATGTTVASALLRPESAGAGLDQPVKVSMADGTAPWLHSESRDFPRLGGSLASTHVQTQAQQAYIWENPPVLCAQCIDLSLADAVPLLQFHRPR